MGKTSQKMQNKLFSVYYFLFCLIKVQHADLTFLKKGMMFWSFKTEDFLFLPYAGIKIPSYHGFFDFIFLFYRSSRYSSIIVGRISNLSFFLSMV